VLSGEATHTNVTVFDLTRSGIEVTICRTRGGHANHYTTGTFPTKYNLISIRSFDLHMIGRSKISERLPDINASVMLLDVSESPKNQNESKIYNKLLIEMRLYLVGNVPVV
jgi:hypothetical protein